jgi:hypothetical protein
LFSISLPASTEVLESFCFEKCSGLREVHFEGGSNLQGIDSDAFSGCSSLKSIRVPKSLKSLKGRGGVEFGGVSGFEIFWYE